MENKTSYETMFAVSLAKGEEAAKATVNKFTGLIAANAEIVQIDEWGKRHFAYPVEDMNEGYYTVVTFKNDGTFPAELQRLMNIDESVVRSMTIKLEYDAAVKAAERAAAEKEKAEKAAAEAPVEETPTEEAPAAEEPATEATED